MSVRREIRRAFADILTDRTAAGPRVTTNRSDMPWREDLPALSIYTVQEVSRVFSEGPRIYEIGLTVVVESFHRRTEGQLVDDDVDELSEQVWNLIALARPVLVDRFDLNNAKSGYQGEDQDYSAEGSKPTGGARQAWLAVFYREETTDPSILSPLRRVDAVWELPSSATDEREALDEIQLPPV